MDLKDDIKSRLSVEDVVSEYVQLKRAGRNFKGLSPWTNEKTPSFMVSPEKQIWHDFSSGHGGDIFSFIMEMEGLDFKDALERLARKAGLEPEDYSATKASSNANLKKRLYEANEAAAKFYQTQFSKNQLALKYVLRKREFTKETALKFRLGYAPRASNSLVDYLRKQNFSDNEIQKAGLSSSGRDMFRGRIIIPLQDPEGRVIGFTARLLEDIKDAPKYINTPQTLIYDKGRHVFGLHLAKEAIRKQKYAVVVEGNLDVIASHQAGVTQTVATAGTAITANHLKTVGRFTSDVRLCFDQDRAGLVAAERAIPLASQANINLYMINIPKDQDPDDLIRDNPGAWRDTIDNPEYALDWLIKRYQDQLDLETASGKRAFSDEVLKVVAALDDQVEQSHYIHQISKILSIDPDALKTKLKHNIQVKESFVKKLHKKGAIQNVSLIAEISKTQNNLLALTFFNKNQRDILDKIEPHMLIDEPAKKLLVNLKNADSKTSQPSDDYLKMLQLIYETLYAELEDYELRQESLRLRYKLVEQYVRRAKQVLSEELKTSDEAKTQQLLEKVKRLNYLLSEVSSG